MCSYNWHCKYCNFYFFKIAGIFKAGKADVTTVSPGLFACQQVSFATPFHGGHEVTVLASLGRSIKRRTRGNGGAIWVESVDQSGFKACILEYSDGSNNTAEVNWIATQSAPSGGKRGSISLGDWTTGTQCKIVNFQQVSVLICVFFFKLNVYYEWSQLTVQYFHFIRGQLSSLYQWYRFLKTVVNISLIHWFIHNFSFFLFFFYHLRFCFHGKPYFSLEIKEEVQIDNNMLNM